MRLLKHAVKKTIPRFFNRHIPGAQRDVLILSSPRSGSTWLMETLYSEPGVKYIDEPLENSILQTLGVFHWRYVTLTEREDRTIRNFLLDDDLIRYFAPWNILHRHYDFVTHRRVIKIIRASALVEWFVKTTDFKIVYLLRHPVPQSLSSMRRRHQCHISLFLEDERFCREYLNRQRVELVEKILRGGSDFERFLVQWCLENVVMLTLREKLATVLLVTYEEMVQDFDGICELLSERLGFSSENLRRNERAASRVTDSSTKRTRESIRQGDRAYLTAKWMKSVDTRELASAAGILKTFGVDCYSVDRASPSEQYLLCQRK